MQGILYLSLIGSKASDSEASGNTDPVGENTSWQPKWREKHVKNFSNDSSGSYEYRMRYE